jgi:hypothetical protein
VLWAFSHTDQQNTTEKNPMIKLKHGRSVLASLDLIGLFVVLCSWLLEGVLVDPGIEALLPVHTRLQRFMHKKLYRSKGSPARLGWISFNPLSNPLDPAR